jgi:hypothetical protein
VRSIAECREIGRWKNSPQPLVPHWARFKDRWISTGVVVSFEKHFPVFRNLNSSNPGSTTYNYILYPSFQAQRLSAGQQSPQTKNSFLLRISAVQDEIHRIRDSRHACASGPWSVARRYSQLRCTYPLSCIRLLSLRPSAVLRSRRRLGCCGQFLVPSTREMYKVYLPPKTDSHCSKDASRTV